MFIRCISITITILLFCKFINSQECASGSVRLIDGGDANAGYLEVCVYNSWGKMCLEHSDATEDDKIGQVICRQLGFDPKVVISNSITSKNHNQLTLLNRMSCAGSERSLFECDYAYGNDCTIKTSFYVYCVTENCTYGSVRLINGKSSDEGKVELCLFSSKRNAYIWATLCDHFWGTFEAQVVCRQLGIPTEIAVAYELPDFSELQISDHISCTGKESFLLDCSINEVNNSCTYYHDVGVACPTISSSSPVVTIPSVTPIKAIKASEVITDNSLKILIHGFTTVLLTESIETRFKQATVDSCNIFCSSHIDVCIGVTVNKRQTWWIPLVENDVKIFNVTNTSSGIEIVTYTALSTNSVLPIKAFHKAVLDGIGFGKYYQVGFISVSAEPFAVSGDISIIGIVIGVILILTLGVILITVSIVTIICCNKRKSSLEMQHQQNITEHGNKQDDYIYTTTNT